MKSNVERRVLRALDDAESDLSDLRKLVGTCLARDDQPTDYATDDPVHRHVRRLTAVILASSYGFHVAKRIATYVVGDIHAQGKRIPSVPDCIVCDKPALPRPKRGMCEADYVAFRRSGLHDVAEFRRRRTGDNG